MGTTNNDQDDAFLRRRLNKLLPDVFFHPIWIDLVRNISNHSQDSLQSLLNKLQLEQVKNDTVSNCQVIFLCAYLQSRLGEHAAAISSIEQAWEQAQAHDLYEITCCAAWGACAISVRWNNFQEAVGWLSRLREKLQEQQEWVLLDILELFKQSIESQAAHAGNVELLDWLLCWGEWSLSKPADRSKDSYALQQLNFPTDAIITRLVRYWSSFWDLIRIRDRHRWFQKQPFQHEKLLHENQMPEATALERKAAQPHEDIHLSSLQLASTPEQASLPCLAVYCLGQFQAFQNEQLIENWLSRKALSVFKYLVLQHPTPVVKEILMDTFWPDSDLEAARRNLHQAIYALRQILKGEQQEFHHIFFKNDCYSLNPNVDIWIDFREFEKCLKAARRLDQNGQLEQAIKEYGTAEGLYQGDFLDEDLYEDWSTLEREQLRNLYISLVDRLSELYLQNCQYTSVIHLCHKVLVKDRCYEAAHRMLMQSYLAQGQRHLAVRQYQTCLQALREDLGIPPSRETVDLYHRIASKRNA